MMLHRIPVFATIALAGMLGLAACSSSPTSPGTGTIQVRMTDAPGPYSSVRVVVEEVSVHRADAADSLSGWVVINSQPATYDLLTLQNGIFAEIGQTTLPAGHYTQLRLKIGTGSTVTVGGLTYPLTIPSGEQTGIKITGSFDVPANGLLDLALDFDAARSVIQTGNAQYKLKPTIRVLPFSTAGSITGTVSPNAATVYAILGADTLQSAPPDNDGRFTLAALPAGSYSVSIAAWNPAAYQDKFIASVTVRAREATDLGVLTLTPR